MSKVCAVCKIEKPFSEFHKDKKSKDNRSWDCKSCKAEYMRNYQKRNRDKLNKKRNLYNRKIRQKILKKLRGKCIRCGFDDWRALQIDHIKGKGNKEREKFPRLGFYRYLLKMSENELFEKYQLLCSNCNWIKRWEKGEHR